MKKQVYTVPAIETIAVPAKAICILDNSNTTDQWQDEGKGTDWDDDDNNGFGDGFGDGLDHDHWQRRWQRTRKNVWDME